jgi:hypothetical protein
MQSISAAGHGRQSEGGNSMYRRRQSTARLNPSAWRAVAINSVYLEFRCRNTLMKDKGVKFTPSRISAGGNCPQPYFL